MQAGRLLLLLAGGLVVEGVGQSAFTKYPLSDSYVTSCHRKEGNYGSETELEVRRYVPEYPADYDEDQAVYHTDGEGTLFPYDQSPLSGFCGEDQTGDRVSFLNFDLTDFSADAVNEAFLRLTPKAFPMGTIVDVRVGCDTSWYENSLTWVTAPFLGQNHTQCRWQSDPQTMYYEEALSCDVTRAVRERAGQRLCFSLDMVVAKKANRRDPVVFWASEIDEQKTRSITVSTDDFRGNIAVTSTGVKPQFEFGTVRGDAESTTWRPHILIRGTGNGEYPDHNARDLREA